MGSFFLLLFIIFVVIPLVRVAWTVFKVRSNYKRAVNDARQQRATYEAYNRPGGWSAPKKGNKPKKVSRSEGEYVEYEEIEVTTAESYSASTDTGTTRTTRYFEERISDVEWEEIKKTQQNS